MTPAEREELDHILHGIQFEDDDWDRQMKADASAGKFDKLIAEALADAKAGKTKSWP